MTASTFPEESRHSALTHVFLVPIFTKCYSMRSKSLGEKEGLKKSQVAFQVFGPGF